MFYPRGYRATPYTFTGAATRSGSFDVNAKSSEISKLDAQCSLLPTLA